MKKKRLEGVLLAFAVAVSTVFAPVNVAAADSVESKSVTLQDSAKDQNGKQTEKPCKSYQQGQDQGYREQRQLY